MKILAKCLSTLLFLWAAPLMAVEEPAFELIAKNKVYELRAYPAVLVAEVSVEAPFDEAGNLGFRPLAGYIFGGNQSRGKLAMTAPVTQKAQPEKIAMTAPVSQVAAEKGFLVQFTMPAGYPLATLPKPDDERVRLREIAPRKVAVLRYSGSWSRERYESKLKLLGEALQKDGLRAVGEPEFARFNSPFQLWFLRRNEIWITVAP